MTELVRPITKSIKPAPSQESYQVYKIPLRIGPLGLRPAPLRSSSDGELTELEGNLDFETFAQLLQNHRAMCIKRASRIMRNRCDAEDAVQSAFRKAFQRRDQFHGDGAFAAWLGRIVENECLMRLRKERNTHFVSLDSPSDSEMRLDLVGSATNPEDELGWKEVVLVLRKEMSRMPRLFREVVLLHDGAQLSMPEVAERLGLSVPAAKSRLSRARKELRSRMGKHCGRRGSGTLLEKAVYSRTAYAG